MCVMVGHAFSQAARESVRHLLPSPLLYANPLSHPRATAKGSILSLTLLLGIYLCTPIHSTPTANVWNPFRAPPTNSLESELQLSGHCTDSPSRLLQTPRLAEALGLGISG